MQILRFHPSPEVETQGGAQNTVNQPRGLLVSIKCDLFNPHHSAREGTVILPILQLRKTRVREARRVPCSHSAGRGERSPRLDPSVVSAVLCFLPEERWGDHSAGHTCPGWGGSLFSDNSSSPSTCTHCLSVHIHGYSFSRQSVASPPRAQPHAHCPTLPRARGLALRRPAPHLLLDLTPRRRLRLNVQTGVSTPQTCPSCRAPLPAKAPGYTYQNAS